MGRPRTCCLAAGVRPAGSAIPVHADETVQDPLAIDPQAVVFVLVGDPGAAVAKPLQGVAAEVKLHEHVLGIDGAGHRHSVAGQLRRIVEGAPVRFLGQQVGGLLQGNELAELLEIEVSVVAVAPDISGDDDDDDGDDGDEDDANNASSDFAVVVRRPYNSSSRCDANLSCACSIFRSYTFAANDD